MSAPAKKKDDGMVVAAVPNVFVMAVSSFRLQQVVLPFLLAFFGKLADLSVPLYVCFRRATLLDGVSDLCCILVQEVN